MKRLDMRRVRKRSNVTGSDLVQEEELDLMDQQLTDAMADELREFLDADVTNVRADPEFKERLRSELWNAVRSAARKGKTERDDDA